MRNMTIPFLVGSSIVLSACAADHVTEETSTKSREDRRMKGIERLLGDEPLSFGGKKRGNEEVGIGVSSYLWRASLDTLSFMPIASADPFGGVIITDWFSPPNNSHERFKVNVFILGRQLRSDGLKVSLFRQEREASGQWVDKAVDPQTIINLEDIILTRARHFKSTSVR